VKTKYFVPAISLRKEQIVVLLGLLVMAASIPQRMNSAGASAAAQRRSSSVIFAVNGEADDYHMDAVAIFNGRRFIAPFSEELKDAQKTFGDKYFAAGRKYRLTFGGGEAGTVTVKKWSEGCNSIHAEVAATTSARLGGQVRALATSSDSLGKRASSRRALTDAERTAVLKLVKNIYTQRRTPANLIGSIKVTNLTATDLDGDGKFEMVGSFMLTAKNKFERDLFLVTQAVGADMRADFMQWQAYQPPPEGFLSSIDFVDQLDVDGDGMGEIVAVQGGFDAYAYLIFKKTAGRWREVYQGMGDAC
jgi:hypothetical protein